MAAMVNASSERFVRRTAGLGLGVLSLVLAGGCFTAQVDPDLPGVFVCDASDEESACPSSLVCVNERCEDPDLAPSLAVLSPEDEESIVRSDVIDLTGMGMAPPFGAFELEIRIQGNLELIAAGAGADPEVGQGHVKVFVDGMEARTIDAGSIDASTPERVPVPLVTGPHRILLQAYRNDGVAYDNPGATATRLFWVENQLSRRPFVAIKSPWPGSVIDTESTDLEVVVAVTPPIELVEPGGGRDEVLGHAHVYYETPMPYPDCVRNPGCDGGYIGVVGAGNSAVMRLPEDAEGTGRLTAVLRNLEHSPYGIPFDCDPADPSLLDPCAPVFETIDLVRVDD